MSESIPAGGSDADASARPEGRGGSVDGPPLPQIALLALLMPAADLLLWRRHPGWTSGALGGVLLVATAMVNRDLLRMPQAWLPLGLAGGLCVALVEQPTVLAAAMLLVLALAFTASCASSVVTGATGWIAGAAVAAVTALARTLDDSGRLLSMKQGADGAPRLIALTRTWLLPSACGAIFLWLFASANPVLDRWLSGLDIDALLRQAPETERLLFWGACATVMWLPLRGRVTELRERWQPAIATGEANATKPSGKSTTQNGVLAFVFSPGAIVRSMVVFNAMFAAQNAMDLAYLWGGKALPPGFTFAGYAHRGAYPLMVTALLAAALVLVAFRDGGTQPSGLARRLMYLWVAQNVVLVVSSIWRMMLYIEFYSLTITRVAVLIWMGLVAVGLGLIIARFVLERGNRWLVRTNANVLAAALYTVCFANLGGIVADYNVAHCGEATGQSVMLDLDYMRELGIEALPAVRQYNSMLSARGLPARDRARTLERDLALALERRLAEWDGWTYRLHRIAQSP